LASGFTLVEILTALAVLMIALSGIIGLLYGSFQHGRAAADRSAAATLMSQGIHYISLEKLKPDGTYKETPDPSKPEVFPTGSSNIALGGNGYRFRYCLRKHEDSASADSPYKGLYALTVVCCRDLERNPDKLVLLSDPVTVYLRERR
jgi:type II secretory pathway pseudopilin PulG